jgi:NAD(P)-dependent dehydrogenase (short-subunit alcohol dehydrogenase family)
LPLIADGGRIVNISCALTRVAFLGSGPYASATGAVEVLTRYQALESGSRRITANVVAAGAVPTDFGNGHLRSDPPCRTTSFTGPRWAPRDTGRHRPVDRRPDSHRPEAGSWTVADRRATVVSEAPITLWADRSEVVDDLSDLHEINRAWLL